MKMYCANCGKEVNRKPSYTKFNKKTFCSVKCNGDYLKRGEVRHCAYCGKDVGDTVDSPFHKSFSEDAQIEKNESCEHAYGAFSNDGYCSLIDKEMFDDKTNEELVDGENAEFFAYCPNCGECLND